MLSGGAGHRRRRANGLDPEEPPRLTRPYVLANTNLNTPATAAPEPAPPEALEPAVVEEPPPPPAPRHSAPRNRAVLLVAAIALTVGIGAVTAIAVGGKEGEKPAAAPRAPLIASFPPIPSTAPSLPPPSPPPPSARPSTSRPAAPSPKVVVAPAAATG